MDRRKEHVLQVGCLLMGRLGIDRVAQNTLAEEAGVAHGSIQNYFGTYDRFKEAVVRYACETDYTRILVQAVGHPVLSLQMSLKGARSAIRQLKV